MSRKKLEELLVKPSPAPYFYELWLMHTSLLRESGMTRLPRVVTEVGPGLDIGVGLCALLCGAEQYVALDVVRHADVVRSERMLDEHLLDERLFPSGVLDDDRLRESLRPERVERIRRALRGEPQSDVRVDYLVPWTRDWDRYAWEVDVVLSRSVMEHVNDLPTAYVVMKHLLRPGGWMSHHVDLKSHGITPDWNGHWGIGEAEWREKEAGYPDLLNRAPASRHLALVEKLGLRIARSERLHERSGLPIDQLLPPWRDLSEEDRTTSGLFLQAQVPAR